MPTLVPTPSRPRGPARTLVAAPGARRPRRPAAGPRRRPRPRPAADVTDGLVLRYDLTQASGTDVDRHLRQRPQRHAGRRRHLDRASGLTLDGVDDHVKLPNNMMAGLSSITVSTDVYIEPSQTGNYFIWGLGNPAVGSPASGTGYLLATGNTLPRRASPPAPGGTTRRTPPAPRRATWPAASGRPSPTPRPAPPARSTRTASRSGRTPRSPCCPARSATAPRPTTCSASPTTPPTTPSRARSGTSGSTTGR